MRSVRSLLVCAALAAAIGWGCSSSDDGAGGTGGTASGGSGGSAAGGSGGSSAGGSGGMSTGGSGGSSLAAPGKIQMTVDGVFHVTDGSFTLYGGSNGVGGYFPDGSNTSLGFIGAAAGTYTSGDGKVDWILNSLQGQYRCKQDIAGSSCSITVIEFGPNRGDHETGTFAGTLAKQSGTGPDTVIVSAGSYDLLGD